MNVREFDDAQRETIREVDLFIKIKPVEFFNEFQVMGIFKR